MRERYVDAERDTKQGVVYYKGEALHPAIIDKVNESDPEQVRMRELLDEAMQDRENLVNVHGIKVVPVKRSETGTLPHFRVNDAKYQDKLFALGVTLHDRFRDLMYDNLVAKGRNWFRKAVYFDGMDSFAYGSCDKETVLENYRPDITVSHSDRSVVGKLALEIVNTSPPSDEKKDALINAGHIILRLNIRSYAESCAMDGFNPTDNDLKHFIMDKRFRLPRTVDRNKVQSVVLVWTDLVATREKIKAYIRREHKLWVDDFMREKKWRHIRDEAIKNKCSSCRFKYPCPYAYSPKCGPNYSYMSASDNASNNASDLDFRG